MAAAIPEADRREPDAETALREPDAETALREPEAATALRGPDTEATFLEPEPETALCVPDPGTAARRPDPIGGATAATVRVGGPFTAFKPADEPGGGGPAFIALILADEVDDPAEGSCARTFAIAVVERTTRVPPRCGAI